MYAPELIHHYLWFIFFSAKVNFYNSLHLFFTLLTLVAEDTRRALRLALTEFSLPKFYTLFGITELTVKSVAATAFRNQPLHMASDRGREDEITLVQLESVVDALVEIIDVRFSRWGR